VALALLRDQRLDLYRAGPLTSFAVTISESPRGGHQFMKQQRYASYIGILAGAWLALQGAVHAQSATIYGSVGNFDVANNQQKDAHGFEVELEGVHPEDIASTFDSQRYGAPTIRATATGTIVRWASAYDPASGFSATTAVHPADAPLAGTCYQWAGAGYDQSGCEHFGASLRVNATRATYRWLVEDPAAPGSVVAGPVSTAVAAPAYSVAPPAVAGAMPVLNADVDAPSAAGVYPTHYADAFWLKIFKTEVPRGIALEELTNDNPSVVPADDAHLETSWVFIQADPVITFRTSGKSSASRGRTRNSGPLGSDTRAVVRRYELYEYAGIYDAVFHQAVCGLSNCSGPAPGEVGALISAQMTAANVVAPSISVARIGSGSIISSDRRITCGAACTAAYTSGDVVTLTATPASGTAFSSWSGACTGTASSCTVTVTDHLNVTAAFSAPPAAVVPAPTLTASPTVAPVASSTTTAAVKLSVGISNKGRIVGGGIDCPNGSCSAKVAAGSPVTLTATPTAAPFINWGGACTGTQPTCSLTVTKDTQVQATFGK
jgi:hypothetical protein